MRDTDETFQIRAIYMIVRRGFGGVLKWVLTISDVQIFGNPGV